MESLQTSVVRSLDGTSDALFPYLPYLLQDITEIGTPAANVLELIRKCGLDNRSDLSVLDLGCGKGSVSLALAAHFGWHSTGLDAVPEFIREANHQAARSNLQDKCRFITADIRVDHQVCYHHDLVVLGAIGPVLGDFEATIKTVSRYLKSGGYIMIDDGYIPDDSSYANPLYVRKSEFLSLITKNGFELTGESIVKEEELRIMNEDMFKKIEHRAHELKKLYPQHKNLFKSYCSQQKKEIDVIENKLICGVFLLKMNDEIL